ncbi:MAG: hypothetical protein OHK0029_05050 [Armatimonadaceae bacterium]
MSFGISDKSAVIERLELLAKEKHLPADTLVDRLMNLGRLQLKSALDENEANGFPKEESEGDPSDEEFAVLVALAEAQAVADRINMRLDSIHHHLQMSIMDVREAHETATAIRTVSVEVYR